MTRLLYKITNKNGVVNVISDYQIALSCALLGAKVEKFYKEVSEAEENYISQHGFFGEH